MEPSKLNEKKCTACSGDTPVMSPEEVKNYLGSLNEWVLDASGGFIQRVIVFDNFKQAVVFFNKVAELAEEEGHHPDIGIENYKKVRINLTTHVARGLTLNDFIMASKIDKLIK